MYGYAASVALLLLDVMELLQAVFFVDPISGTEELLVGFTNLRCRSHYVRHSLLISSSATGYRVFELRVWPMGFSWSPWVAQCISMSLVLAGDTGEFVFVFSKEFAPPYVRVENKRGKLVAVVVVFYDNFLVMATVAPVYEWIVAHILLNARILGAVWKIEEDKVEQKEARVKRPAFGSSRGSVDFLGLSFQITSEGLRWSHVFQDSVSSKPIYWKEAYAAATLLLSILEKDEFPGLTEIRHAIDNSAASVAVNKSYSPDVSISELLMNVDDLLARKGIRLLVIRVRSADTAADEPSRGKEIDESRCERCRSLLLAGTGLTPKPRTFKRKRE